MQISFLILICILTASCANGNYIYTRVGVGMINTTAEWKGADHTAAHAGVGYVLKASENNLVDFNWTHNSQWSLGEPVRPEKEESWLDYFGVDYVRIFD